MQRTIAYLSLMATLIISACTCGARRYNDAYGQPMYVYPGIGLGTVIAVVVSWSRNKSILWAIIHGLLGWLYVIYTILVRK